MKKGKKQIILIFGLAAMLGLSAGGVIASAEENGNPSEEEDNVILRGDVNEDGKVDGADVILLRRYLAGWDTGYNWETPLEGTIPQAEALYWSQNGDLILEYTNGELLNLGSMPKRLIRSGKAGENITWSFYDDFSLVFEGTGEMYDYETNSPYGNATPWGTYSDIAREVVLSEGITSIGDGAFSYTKISDIRFPSTLQRIGVESFYACPVLEEICIPDSVTRIEEYAFWNTDLESIYFTGTPKEWEKIEKNDAIAETVTIYYGLPEVEDHEHSFVETETIPATCATEGYIKYTCEQCERYYKESIPVTGEHSYENGFCAVCGEKKPSEGLKYALSSDGTYYTVTGIGNCMDKELIIPATYNGKPILSIGRSAFWNCSRITSVTIPDSVTSIEDWAFQNCSSLTSVMIGNSVTKIGGGAFESCTNLTSVTFENSTGWWVSTDSTATSGTSIAGSELANDSIAATYLRDTYRSCYWKRG